MMPSIFAVINECASGEKRCAHTMQCTLERFETQIAGRENGKKCSQKRIKCRQLFSEKPSSGRILALAHRLVVYTCFIYNLVMALWLAGAEQRAHTHTHSAGRGWAAEGGARADDVHPFRYTSSAGALLRVGSAESESCWPLPEDDIASALCIRHSLGHAQAEIIADVASPTLLAGEKNLSCQSFCYSHDANT